MQKKVTIGLVGDYHHSVPAHQAIPLALKRAAETTGIDVEFEWIPTVEITSVSRVSSFDGIWCVPASPYQSTEGALLAIRHAREKAIPFLGTCGGFQHAIIEYARNVLGWADAEHAETAPDATRAVISPLECALVETVDRVRLFPGTRIATAYGVGETLEGYRCRYGLNPEFRTSLVSGPLRVAGDDEAGDVRVVEMDEHPFFVATLFQPERAALRDQPAPIVSAFVEACAMRSAHAAQDAAKA
ncbi:CTP synthase C-terminal region-related (seleno)protein [Paraburkholderia caffeinilytica]|uniref:CTP synthase C-terminal region-related (seleno)protein n=1 Tax=Paraburkholderia caffeinilytica TaxID=1761016 RepID=UPI003DA1C859